MGLGKPSGLPELPEPAGPEAGMPHSAWDSGEASVTHGQVRASESCFSMFSHLYARRVPEIMPRGSRCTPLICAGGSMESERVTHYGRGQAQSQAVR